MSALGPHARSAVVIACVACVACVAWLAPACWFPGAPIRTTGRPVPNCPSANPVNTPCDPDDSSECMSSGERLECARPMWRRPMASAAPAPAEIAAPSLAVDAPPQPVVDAGLPTPSSSPSPAPRGPMTWNDLGDGDRSTAPCRVDAECVVATEVAPCRCCNQPRVFALHVREQRRAPPPQPPCMPACASDELPCRAPPVTRAADVFRARCRQARCRLEPS